MQINIINDNRLSGRYEALIKEFEQEGITDYKIWNPVEDVKSVVRSINLSHKQIVAWAKKEGLKEVCIGEDDLMFTDKGGWQWFLSNKPKDFDIYLWGSYSVPLTNNIVLGFQLYIMSEKFYDTFLNLPEKVPFTGGYIEHIDDQMNFIEVDCKYCYPFSALQRPCWSANNHAISNYNKNLNPEDIWQNNHTLPLEKKMNKY